jgi:uncharacterized protein (TIGR03067 family)
MVSGRQDGVDTPAEAMRSMRCSVEGMKVNFTRNGDVVEEVTIQLDVSQNPRALDATLDNGRVAAGIYKLENELFTLCYVHPGKQRPTDFRARAGSGELLSAWKRVTKSRDGLK